MARLFREVFAGFLALACLIGIFFGVLRWRMNTPEEHLNLGRMVEDRVPGQSHE